jgi:putative addiction module component (TIGR02574 family)
MTVTRGFLIIILSGFAFALGGGLIGYALAVIVPGYYRGVFSSGREPWFDPVGVGVGLGVSQGLLCGLILGAIVVLAVAWYNSRRNSLDMRLTPTERQELQRRLANHAANSDEGVPVEQIKAEAVARFRK